MIMVTISEEEFKSLADEWEIQTAFLSDVGAIIEHEIAQSFLSFGYDVVPFILKRMQNKETQSAAWCGLLGRITGENPIPESLCGYIAEMEEVWVNWGLDKKLIS